MQYTRLLARFVATKASHTIPNHVVNRAKQCLLDAIGVMLAGSRTQTGQCIIEFIERLGNREESSIIGAKRTSCQSAAFANGSLAEILELDDGSRTMSGHPSSVIIPASLAVGEVEKAKGKEIIASIVLGYDLGIRVGAAMFPSHGRRGFMATATCGTFGATAAAGKILGLDEEAMASALGIAGLLVPAAVVESFLGTTIKPAHAGQAAEVAIKSALLARAGFNSCHTIFEGSSGFCQATSDEFNPSRLTEKLGEKYEIMDVYFKTHACCRHSHGAIDAMIKLKTEHHIKPDDVKSIVVRTNRGAAGRVFRFPKPSDPYTSFQHSLPYAIVAALLFGQVGPPQFDEEEIRDLKIFKLMRKVRCLLDPELDHLYPERRPTALEITTKKNERFSARVDYPRGSAENPLSSHDLLKKFRGLASGVVGKNRTEKIVKAVNEIEKLDDIGTLMKTLRSA